MNSDGVAAVFQLVALFMGGKGKFTLFADGNKAGLELKRGGSGENEPARVDANDRVNGARSKIVDQQVDAAGEKARICQDGGDVFELNAGDREIWNVADRIL